ncbi:MAG TPA: hypothetical protein VLL76_03940 [Candidatus Omnitrophota bacterium]|nr:hypothetical protein [Candidatus Omnitrophota bacterium]
MRSWPLILAVAALLPVTAAAQMAPSEGGRAAYARFKAMDRDNDRALSLAELRKAGGERASAGLFLMLDADGDGRLSLKEVEGAGGSARLGRFEAYDVDKNGYVLRREFPKVLDPRLVAALDRNGDARLSLREIRSSFAGARAVRPDTPTARKSARVERGEQTLCWVPNFGSADRWLIEMPVLGGGCRTQ